LPFQITNAFFLTSFSRPGELLSELGKLPFNPFESGRTKQFATRSCLGRSWSFTRRFPHFPSSFAFLPYSSFTFTFFTFHARFLAFPSFLFSFNRHRLIRFSTFLGQSG
jgi:hypothetical protein